MSSTLTAVPELGAMNKHRALQEQEVTEHHQVFTGSNDHFHPNIKRITDGLLWYGLGLGGSYWHMCSLIWADFESVEQLQQIFTCLKMHVGLRGCIRGFLVTWGWQRVAARQCSNCIWRWALGSAGSQQNMPEQGLLAAEILYSDCRTEAEQLSHSSVFLPVWNKLGISE